MIISILLINCAAREVLRAFETFSVHFLRHRRFRSKFLLFDHQVYAFLPRLRRAHLPFRKEEFLTKRRVAFYY